MSKLNISVPEKRCKKVSLKKHYSKQPIFKFEYKQFNILLPPILLMFQLDKNSNIEMHLLSRVLLFLILFLPFLVFH